MQRRHRSIVLVLIAAVGLPAGCTGGHTSPTPAAAASRPAPSPADQLLSFPTHRCVGINNGVAVQLDLRRHGSAVAGTAHVSTVTDGYDAVDSTIFAGNQMQGRIRLALDDPVGPVAQRRINGEVDSGDYGLTFRTPSGRRFVECAATRSTTLFARYSRILHEPGGLSGHITRAVFAARARRYVDVDGDGRRDRVVVRWTHRSRGYADRVEVTVLTASGQRASRSIGVYQSQVGSWLTPLKPPLAGVPDLDQQPGREIVIASDQSPASYVGLRVLRWSDGTLQALRPPGGFRWFVGGSLGTGGQGYICGRDAVTHVTESPWNNPGPHKTDFDSFRWTPTGWVLVRHWQTAVPRRAAERSRRYRACLGAT